MFELVNPMSANFTQWTNCLLDWMICFETFLPQIGEPAWFVFVFLYKCLLLSVAVCIKSALGGIGHLHCVNPEIRNRGSSSHQLFVCCLFVCSCVSLLSVLCWHWKSISLDVLFCASFLTRSVVKAFNLEFSCPRPLFLTPRAHLHSKRPMMTIAQLNLLPFLPQVDYSSSTPVRTLICLTKESICTQTQPSLPLALVCQSNLFVHWFAEQTVAKVG